MNNDVLKWGALIAALVATASAEYELALAVGFNQWVAAAVPGALDLYTVRALRTGREVLTAVIAMIGVNAASHLVTAGLLPVNVPLVVAVSAIAPLVLWRIHSLGSAPDAPRDAPDAEDAVPSPAVPSVPPRPEVVPAGTRLLPLVPRPRPTVTLEREDAQDGDGTPELPPGTDQDAEGADDGPPPEPPLMTAADVARHYGVDPSTVRNYVSNGTLTVHSKNARGHNLFHPDQLPDYVGVLA
ncbi:helix-turn-helix domain-containing protein [Streptomyces sp. NPDC090493]|uniref:helix-turn-helix domain-containing protein n=1 Tax=Streptomyces sp. NPDC090493 TaxID=3365964 RepID=UPI0038215A0E